MPDPSHPQPRASRASRALVVLVLVVGVLVSGLALRSTLTRAERFDAFAGAQIVALIWLSVTIVAQLFVIDAVVRRRATRRRVVNWRTVRCGFYVVCAAWLISLVWLQPFQQLAVEVLLASAAGAFALGILLLGGPEPAPLPRGRGIVELIAFNVCLTAVLAELGLALLAYLNPSPILMVANEAVRKSMAALARPPGKLHMGFPTNTLGHYDTEFARREQRTGTTVAMIGDSFSASFVPHKYHFTTVAEGLLGDTEIYNFGIPGIGPHEYLHLLGDQVLAIDPDAVVVGIFAGNDLTNLRPRAAAASWVLPWFDRQQVRLFIVPSRLLALSAERARGGAHSPAEAFSGHGDDLLTTEQQLVAAYPWLHDARLERASFSEVAYLELVRRRLTVACAPSPERLSLLFACIDAMRRVAGDRPFGIVLLPAEFQVENALWQRALAGMDAGIASRLDPDEPETSIAAGLAARGIPCLDLLPVFRAEPAAADGDRHCYLLRDTHFNVRGNAVAARAIAPFVRTLLTQRRR